MIITMPFNRLDEIKRFYYTFDDKRLTCVEFVNMILDLYMTVKTEDTYFTVSEESKSVIKNKLDLMDLTDTDRVKVYNLFHAIVVDLHRQVGIYLRMGMGYKSLYVDPTLKLLVVSQIEG